jgi:hypothetical protein
VAAAEEENPVETVGSDGAHPALGIGVRIRSLDRRPDHLDRLGTEDLVEGVAELLVAIVDEESERPRIRELHDEVAWVASVKVVYDAERVVLAWQLGVGLFLLTSLGSVGAVCAVDGMVASPARRP